MQSADPPFPKFPEQNADGVDLSLIRCNLQLSATERLRKADQAIRGLERMRSMQPESIRRIAAILRKQRG